MSEYQLLDSYLLVDTGGGEKLERFGELLLRRPASLAIWEKSSGLEEWERADAVYDPEEGWKTQGDLSGRLSIDFGVIKLKLRLQENGQLGLFPDHLTYLSEIGEGIEALSRLSNDPLRVLNLFAYTGMATVFSASLGAQVTHIDLSKKALGWANENIEINGISSEQIRLIQEDAMAFLEREKRRGNQYDIVIADPPVFSRVSKKNAWKLEEVVSRLARGASYVLAPERGMVVITSHHMALNHIVLKNLCLDIFDSACSIDSRTLTLKEAGRGRELPAGNVVICRHGW